MIEELYKQEKPLKYRFDPNTNIRKLPSNITMDLRNLLQTGLPDKNWRLFVALLPQHFTFKSSEIEKMALLVQSSQNPVDHLFLELGGKGFTVKDLAVIVDRMRLEKTLFDLMEYIPLEIVQHPESSVTIEEEDTLKLSVEAYGLPYPRYQWFNGDDEITGAMQATLLIDHIREEDAGVYCCRLYNAKDPNLAIFSNCTEVEVIIKPNNAFDDSVDDLKQPGDEFHPSIICHPRSLSVCMDSSFTLECKVAGNQPVRYLWFHNEQFFIESRVGRLQVDNATEYHNGVYYCEVRGNFFTAKSKLATISVSNISNSLVKATSPEILTQPKSCVIAMGGSVLLCCEGRGTRPLTYLWFKDGEAIPDSNVSEYKLRNINSIQQEGLYVCLINNTYGSKLSQGAFLRISNCVSEPISPQLTATDKVALLIGNYEYRSEKKLKAPKSDIQILSEIYCNLDFKVVSLLNLTRIEMMNAVNEFCELIGPGVYAVFYFCGHGFEENKNCYLVPQDAQTGYDTRHCLCVEYVQSRMQEKEPEVSCLILDVCRTENKVNSPESAKANAPPVKPYVNTVFCYATSWGHLAFENNTHGLLVESLQKFLFLRISIEEVIAKVREDFGRRVLPDDKIQDPEIKSNLQQPRRSFCDEIIYTGHTQAYTQRLQNWKRCLEKPLDIEIVAEPKHLGIILEANFQTDFSNVLTIFLTVKSQGKTGDDTIAYVGRHPNTISVMGDPRDITGDGKYKKTKNTLQDIQKIKEKLAVNIYVKYKLNGVEHQSTETQLDLNYPLIAKLHLWKEDRKEEQIMLPGRREPTEQEDNL